LREFFMGALKKHPMLFWGVGITMLFLLFSLFRVGLIEKMDLTIYDLMMRLRADTAASSEIVIVNIDEDSLESLGRWPWPRAQLAYGIEKIAAASPRVIGLSVIFAEPEKSEGLIQMERVSRILESSGLAENPQLMALHEAIDQARMELDNDARFAAALAGAGSVVLPVFFKHSAFAAESRGAAPAALSAQAFGGRDDSAGGWWPSADQATLPIEAFMEAAGGLGHINFSSDLDGTVRREWLFYEYEGLFIPSYTAKLLQKYLNVSTDKTFAVPGKSVEIGGLSIPTSRDSRLFVSFKGPFNTFRGVSFADVINDKVPASVFRDKLVIVAPSAAGIGMLMPTPVGNLPQGEFAANVIWTMQSGRFIAQPGWTGLVRVLLMLAIGLLIVLVFPRIKAGPAAGLFGGILVVLALGPSWLFASGVWFSTTYALLLLIAGYIGVVTIGYLVTETGKEKAEGESAETNRMLGVSFQSQGMLDMAFEKFRRCPVDQEMKGLLYNLGLDYERKRQLNKAAMVYEYIEETDPKYKDVATRKTRLMQASETMVFGQGMFGGTGDGAIITDGVDTKPTLGRYEIVKQLGKGAMGVVYLGQDPRINRTTAIKTIRFTDDFEEEQAAEMKKKFFREAESAGTLAHPHIVTIYDAGEEQELAYIAMEYLEGEDLEKYIKPENLMTQRKVVGYMADIADALDYAHSKGVVHRDIKPANVMLLKSGVVKVTDFGIARIQASSQTATGVVKGTPYYMSPEQITGEKVDGRTDIFSLGVMTYQLLTGKLPFTGDTIAALMHQIMNVKHPDPREYNPKLYKPLVAIIDKALEKDREKRYQTAGQMAAHLRELAKKIDAAALAQKSQSKSG
jgi:serine/threonine-protein kinase